MVKDPKDMTEDEKFDICVMAGCDISPFARPDGSYGLRTTHPCGILHDGQKYIVGQRVNG
ncbi:hypothetical protein LCGC14_0885380 [marine sediment metagenome]|uniref:Uncharacterized protein n=1 Tax=marine sediment metagenome TaxID=412755 RepID=A0A0F9S7P6_9ZZZZ